MGPREERTPVPQARVNQIIGARNPQKIVYDGYKNA